MTDLPAQPDRWYTLEQAGELCHRQPKTIRNLVYDHDLPRRLLARTRNRKRFRVMFLRPDVVAYLQRITLYGQKDVQRPSLTPPPPMPLGAP